MFTNYITKQHTQKDYTYVHITSTFLFFNLEKAMDENENSNKVRTYRKLSCKKLCAKHKKTKAKQQIGTHTLYKTKSKSNNTL